MTTSLEALKKKPLKSPGRLPDDPLKRVYRWADYIELRCIISPDDAITAGDLTSMLRVDPEEAPEGTGVEDDIAQNADDAQSVGQRRGAARKVDNRERLADEVFILLRMRMALYGDVYPFVLVSDGQELKLKDPLDDAQLLYISVLLCALGRYITRHSELTQWFERLAAVALRRMMPIAEVHVFGTAGDDTDLFRGNFLNRVRQLATWMGEVPQGAAMNIDSDESGDRGLDVVGMVSLGDDLPGRILVYAQVACTEAWTTKQDSPSPDAWDGLVQPLSPQITACVIPDCFRRGTGEWFDRTLIHRRLILDRWRVLHQLVRSDADLLELRSLLPLQVLQEVLKFDYVD